MADRASARLRSALGILASRHTALRVLLRTVLAALAVPCVLGIDDFTLRRGSVYATVLVDAETARRVDVVPAASPKPPGSGCRTIPGSRSCAGRARGLLLRGGPPGASRPGPGREAAPRKRSSRLWSLSSRAY